MRSSKLEKIIEEEGNSVNENMKHQHTIYMNKDTIESRDSAKLPSMGRMIFSSSYYVNTTETNPERQEKLRESEINSKMRNRKSKIEIVKSQRELTNIRNNSSFFEGKPRSEEDIIKLECPLYRCHSNTIIRSKVTKDNLDKKTTEPLVLDDLNDKNDKKSEKTKNKRRAAIVDVKLANTFELRTFKSLFMTILQIINCIIRYTIVQFPFCIRYLGLVYGPIIIFVIGAMSIFPIYFLIKVSQQTKEKSYSAFAYKWWGLKGKIFILILNSLSSFGSCMSYIIIFLKLIPNLVSIGTGESFLANKTLLSIILSFWLVVYCYQKDVSGIKAAAYWGVLAIISFLFLDIADMLIASWYELIPEDKYMNFFDIDFHDYNVYSSIASIILSFSFHTYAFSIYDCMDAPDSRKMLVTSSIGIFTSTLIYLMVGTIGYILYGNSITDSILDTMGYTNISVLMSISFVINVIMSFPITFNGLKHYFIYLIELILTLLIDSCCSKKKENEDKFLTSNNNTDRKGSELDKDNESDEEEDEEEEIANAGHHAHHIGHLTMIQLPLFIEYLIVLGLFVLIFYTANKFPNMKTLFGFLGATTANLFTFILPALFYIKFAGKKLCSV